MSQRSLVTSPGIRMARPGPGNGCRPTKASGMPSSRPSSRTSSRSEEHTSELQSLMRSSYAVFCLKKKIQLHAATHLYMRVTLWLQDHTQQSQARAKQPKSELQSL